MSISKLERIKSELETFNIPVSIVRKSNDFIEVNINVEYDQNIYPTSQVFDESDSLDAITAHMITFISLATRRP